MAPMNLTALTKPLALVTRPNLSKYTKTPDQPRPGRRNPCGMVLDHMLAHLKNNLQTLARAVPVLVLVCSRMSAAQKGQMSAVETRPMPMLAAAQEATLIRLSLIHI